MLAWLLVSPYLVLASLAPVAPRPTSHPVLHRDALLLILSRLEVADLYSAFFVSEGLRELAHQAIRIRYGVQIHGKICVNYTAVLHELQTEIEDARMGHEVIGANAALCSSLRFMGLRYVLTAAFGRCIRYASCDLPKFDLHELSFDIIYDDQKISVLPYALDQKGSVAQLAYYIRGLVDLERLDLLESFTFPRINTLIYNELMSIPLPDSVAISAANRLQQNEPTSELASLLALIQFGDQATVLPEDCQVPLFLLRHLYEKGMKIPQSLVLVDGMCGSSISFWMHLFKKDGEESKGLLDFIRKHGDDETRHLANAFYGPVSFNGRYYFDKDVYQAMLIRFHFSPSGNKFVARNYELMLEKPLKPGYHTLCALLDWQQYTLVDQCGFKGVAGIALEALIHKMYRLKDESLNALISKAVGRLKRAPKLLKSLVRQSADEPFVQLVWNSIQSKTPRSIDDQCCRAPQSTLSRLVYEPDISVDTVQRMLDMPKGFQMSEEAFSAEAHVLYTVLFWEAPERVIEYFLALVPRDYKLKGEFVWRLLLSTKYSSVFCRKLIARLDPEEGTRWDHMEEFRPDLFKELSLPDD